jgi:3-methylfumaryl-CoA hydratase
MTDSLEDLQRFVGNSQTAQDVITASQVGRLAVALDVDHPAPNKGDPVPPGWHGVFFPPLVPLSRLREDGQPSGGGIAPPVPLPRRRLVGVRGVYHDALQIGDDVTKLTEVAAITIKDWGAGPTALVTVRETISTDRGTAVIDERDVLYFGEQGPGQPEEPPTLPATAAWTRTCESNPVMIFRLSAVRFNSHRIHYDRDYATKTEGYPGLVVPVTLVSFLMMELCRAEAPDTPLVGFNYNSEKPVFDLGPYTIYGAPDGDRVRLWATDYAGELAVTAEASLASS